MIQLFYNTFSFFFLFYLNNNQLYLLSEFRYDALGQFHLKPIRYGLSLIAYETVSVFKMLIERGVVKDVFKSIRINLLILDRTYLFLKTLNYSAQEEGQTPLYNYIVQQIWS